MLEKDYSNIAIESDSTVAVQLIKEVPNVEHPLLSQINDAKAILARTNSPISYIYRQANQCADHLGHMSAEQDEELVVSMDP